MFTRKRKNHLFDDDLNFFKINRRKKRQLITNIFIIKVEK